MAGKRSGLGKGLDGLFPSYPSAPQKKEEAKLPVDKQVPDDNKDDKEPVKTLKITDVEPNPDQPRKSFDEDSLEELSESLKSHGLVQPIVVVPRNGIYMIVAGERRWRAAKKAGLKEIPVIVRDYSDKDILEISLIENIQRENLDPIEEAMAYQRLIKEFNIKQDELAERVSKSRTAITNSLRLLKLNPQVQKMVVDGMISAGHARALLGITDMEKQLEAAMTVFDEQLSVRETEKLVKKITTLKPDNTPKKSGSMDYIYDEMQNNMQNALGTKVRLNRQTDKKGRIEISYYSIEELERIYDMIKACSLTG